MHWWRIKVIVGCKQWFYGFGEVQYFVPILHQVTKYVLECYFVSVFYRALFIVSFYSLCRWPRGIGFLKFKTVESANIVISTAGATSGMGILLKGRPLKVLKALDKKSVDDKELEKAKNEVHDHRNLYLAKVCFLLCNSCGAGCWCLIFNRTNICIVLLYCNRRDLFLRELQLLKGF